LPARAQKLAGLRSQLLTYDETIDSKTQSKFKEGIPERFLDDLGNFVAFPGM
jgi:hypothetical protein